MRPWASLALVAAALALAALAARAYALSAVRPVVFNETLNTSRLAVFTVPAGLLDGFRGLYVSGTQDCQSPWPTAWHVFGDTVVVVFKPEAAVRRAYLCYGDVYYSGEGPAALLASGKLSAHAEGPVEETSSGRGSWVRVSGTATVDAVDLGTYSHVVSGSYNATLYTYQSTTISLVGDHGTVDSATVGQYSYVEVVLDAAGADTRWLNATVSGDAYVRRDGYRFTYVPYVWARNSTSYNGSNLWILVARYSNATRVSAESGGYAYNASMPPGTVLWLTPLGAGVDTGTGSSFYPGASSSDELNLTVYEYHWNGTGVLEYTVYAGNASAYSATIGPESALSTGTGASSIGNATVTVEVDVNPLARSVYLVAGYALGAASAALAVLVIERGVLWAASSLLSAGLGAALLIRVGEYRQGILIYAAVTTVVVALVLYRLARRLV